MGKAARAIIFEDNKILVMYRNNQGNEYFTLVGGKLDDNEDAHQALVREVKEETGLDVVASRHVFTESHPDPYNDQFIYLCQVAPHGAIEIQDSSEEATMNKLGLSIHRPMWVDLNSFPAIAFRTPQLQQAIIKCVNNGFPDAPQDLA